MTQETQDKCNVPETEEQKVLARNAIDKNNNNIFDPEEVGNMVRHKAEGALAHAKATYEWMMCESNKEATSEGFKKKFGDEKKYETNVPKTLEGLCRGFDGPSGIIKTIKDTAEKYGLTMSDKDAVFNEAASLCGDLRTDGAKCSKNCSAR